MTIVPDFCFQNSRRERESRRNKWLRTVYLVYGTLLHVPRIILTSNSRSCDLRNQLNLSSCLKIAKLDEIKLMQTKQARQLKTIKNLKVSNLKRISN